jgi:thymidylate kinase
MTGRDPRLFSGAAGGATERNTGCNTVSGGAVRSAPSRYQAQSSMALADDAALPGGPGLILLGVFETLERAGIPYCVLHGYDAYPWWIKSDVDCMISADVRPFALIALLQKNCARIGADVVRARGYELILSGRNVDGSPCFLKLDMSVDYEIDDRLFYAGSEVLESRNRHRQFSVPAVRLEFGCYLVRKIAKGRLDEEHGQKLTHLYQQDATGCRQQVDRFWKHGSSALILSAAESGKWEPVRLGLDKFRAELRTRATLRSPWRVAGNRLRHLAGRMSRVWRLDGGLSVVFLGPDGAGKSSVVQAMGQSLAGAFPRTACYSFPPALLDHFLHRPQATDSRPHELPLRSWPASVVRAVLYWFVYNTLGYYVTVRLALGRSTLVMHDRHFVDALVDPRRYRYGGPLWLLRLIWRIVPKPDLLILLDAAPAVLQARKQEVSFEESARQREAYLSLMQTMKNGYVVDAARPLEQVVGDVNDIVLRHLAARIARRFGLAPNSLYRRDPLMFSRVRSEPP